MSAQNNNDERVLTMHHSALLISAASLRSPLFRSSWVFTRPVRARLSRVLARVRVCPIRSGLPLRAEVCAGRCVTL